MRGAPSKAKERGLGRPRATSRLVVRIYLLCFGTILIAGIGLAVLARHLFDPPRQSELAARFHLLQIADEVGDPPRLDRALEELAEELRAGVTLYDDDGALVASNLGPPMPPLRPDQRDRLDHEPSFGFRTPRSWIVAAAVDFGDGRHGYGLFAAPPLGPPTVSVRAAVASVAALLLILAVAAALFARSLARPITRLASAARDLGAGQLDARAALDRGDELGDLGRAFDDMAERLGQLLRSQKELLANVSHELRTPLSRIRVALDLAAEGDGERARESLGEIGQDLAELEQLVGDILVTARLDLAAGRAGSAGPVVRAEPLDPRELLLRAAERFRKHHGEARLALELDSDLGEIAGDVALLRRVVDNLLDNAAKYSEPTTTVTLVGRVTADAVEIQVIDRGIGIAQADRERVFEPFFRSDRSRTRGTGGIGLGLTLARRIVEAHDGSITIGPGDDAGTRVTFAIPRIEKRSGASSSPGIEPRKSS